MNPSWSEIYQLTERAAKASGLFRSDVRRGYILVGRGGLAVGSVIGRFYPKVLDHAILLSVRQEAIVNSRRMLDCLRYTLADYNEVTFIDDIYDTGATINYLRQFWAKEGATAFTLYARRTSPFFSGLHVGEVIASSKWISFPWEAPDRAPCPYHPEAVACKRCKRVFASIENPDGICLLCRDDEAELRVTSAGGIKL